MQLNSELIRCLIVLVLCDYVKKPTVESMLSNALLDELSGYIPVVRCNYTVS